MMKGNRLIEDKTILIAGAASLVGKSVVNFFLRHGATVIAPVLNEQDLNILKQLSDDIKTGKLFTHLADLPDYDDAFDIAAATAEKFGKIDIGISVFKYSGCDKQLSKAFISDWIKMLDEEITPFFISANIMLQSMKQRNNGMYVSICDNSFFEKENPAPFDKIITGAKMEMSRIFAEEIEPFDIKYRHLWVNMSDKNPNEVAEENNPCPQYTDAVGMEIIDMYFDKTPSNNVFQQLTL